MKTRDSDRSATERRTYIGFLRLPFMEFPPYTLRLFEPPRCIHAAPSSAYPSVHQCLPLFSLAFLLLRHLLTSGFLYARATPGRRHAICFRQGGPPQGDVRGPPRCVTSKWNGEQHGLATQPNRNSEKDQHVFEVQLA